MEAKMKKNLLVMGVGAILLLSACSSTSVRFDYERGVDFSQFKTFDFFEVPEDVEADPLVLKRIDRAIADQLTAKGLTQSSSDPDLMIAVHTAVKDKVDVTNWGYGYADYYWHGYWGPRYGGGGTQVTQYEEGTLIIDMVDNAEDELIWRGEASRALPYNPTAEKIDALIDDVVARILVNYPPPNK
jgi:hypothetical protein